MLDQYNLKAKLEFSLVYLYLFVLNVLACKLCKDIVSFMALFRAFGVPGYRCSINICK